MKLNEIVPTTFSDDLNIDLRKKKLTQLPPGLPEVCRGIVWVYDNNLTSLKGSPKKVKEFYCGDNKLTSLVGGPTEVEQSFGCSQGNKLRDLTGAPKKVGDNFRCNSVSLKSLKGAPIFIGCGFECMHNQLTSLHNIHLHLPKVRYLYFLDNPIKSHVLGLLKIEGCKEVELDNKVVQGIINKYLPLGDLIDCQEELIEAGFPEYAQL